MKNKPMKDRTTARDWFTVFVLVRGLPKEVASHFRSLYLAALERASDDANERTRVLQVAAYIVDEVGLYRALEVRMPVS